MALGILERILSPHIVALNPSDERLWSPNGWGGATAAGVAVTPEKALQVSAFFACVAILGETMGSLPLVLFEASGRTRERASGHPVHRLLHEQPNKEQTPFDFKEHMTAVAAMRGEAVAEFRYGGRVSGYPESLEPLHPDRLVKERLRGSGETRYTYREEDGRTRVLQRENLFVLRGRLGMSMVQLARETLGEAMATQEFAARAFGQGTRLSGVLSHPNKLEADTAQRIAASWQTAHAGPQNAGKVAVLEEGMTWTQIGMSNEDAQYLESRKFTVSEVARWFRIQAHKIGDLEHATFSNIEHLGIEFVTDTVMSWAVRWEQACNRDLLLERDRPRRFSKVMLQALLRGDNTSRADFYTKMTSIGAMTRNEVRELEEMNPLPGLDDPLQALNMANPGGNPTAPPRQPDRAPSPAPRPNRRAEALAEDAARRVIRKEVAAVTKAAPRLASEPEGWRAWVEGFYAEHEAYVRENLHIGDVEARDYCADHCDELLSVGLSIVEDWEGNDTPRLTRLALGHEEAA